ncbi:hypothetical protein J0676_02110 [Vibrio sp. Vb2880]|uniref:hypothetical protein n=1 Tax=Vibrio TaxID=662 RepID=UPI0001B9351D|nr:MULTISPECIES: hypothetical protein [Vibrio]EEX41286.1 hypothetical protein VFA_001120 [Vibrio furnissii CIP 102972]MBO0212285.1 hypothetical protein [Vibrio sp. Vb2880]MCG6235791.1 hypothetical protein [Vibrio furnissii]MCG6257582.1 hypothetical protein [Vibrio furnissii]UON47939.1 hypothetical protein IUJ52_14030 [Vibrio furnissii]
MQRLQKNTHENARSVRRVAQVVNRIHQHHSKGGHNKTGNDTENKIKLPLDWFISP